MIGWWAWQQSSIVTSLLWQFSIACCCLRAAFWNSFSQPGSWSQARSEKRTDLVFYEVKVSSYYHSAVQYSSVCTISMTAVVYWACTRTTVAYSRPALLTVYNDTSCLVEYSIMPTRVSYNAQLMADKNN